MQDLVFSLTLAIAYQYSLTHWDTDTQRALHLHSQDTRRALHLLSQDLNWPNLSSSFLLLKDVQTT